MFSLEALPFVSQEKLCPDPQFEKSCTALQYFYTGKVSEKKIACGEEEELAAVVIMILILRIKHGKDVFVHARSVFCHKWFPRIKFMETDF